MDLTCPETDAEMEQACAEDSMTEIEKLNLLARGIRKSLKRLTTTMKTAEAKDKTPEFYNELKEEAQYLREEFREFMSLFCDCILILEWNHR